MVQVIKKRNSNVCKNLYIPIKFTFQDASYFFGYIKTGGYAVAQLVEALRYKPEGRGFDPRWCDWNISLISSFGPRYSPGIDSASNINECQE
jgi:hypothetical protein